MQNTSRAVLFNLWESLCFMIQFFDVNNRQHFFRSC